MARDWASIKILFSASAPSRIFVGERLPKPCCSFARECQVGMVVTLGAYLDEVLYTRPVPLSGFSTDPKLVEELDLVPSRYQGPTGIIGVLGRRLPRCRNHPSESMGVAAALSFRVAQSARHFGACYFDSISGSVCEWTPLRSNGLPPISRQKSTKRSMPTPNSPLSCAN